MTTITPLHCSCCPRMVGQLIRRADGTVGLILVARHDKHEKHVTFWTAAQLREMLAALEQADPVEV